MKDQLQPMVKQSDPDYTLVFSILEKELMRGENMERCRKILRQETVWKALSSDRLLQWARLAQMAGDMETAIRTLTHLAQTNPDSADAWAELIDLLQILDRKAELAAVMAAAKTHRVSVKNDEAVLKIASVSDGVPDAASAPFESLRQRQDAIDHYMTCFSGREDCFARQWANKQENKQGYVPVHRRLDRQDIEDHLRGTKTYGIYLLKSDSTVHVGVIDADLVVQYRSGKISADDKRHIFRERAYLASQIRERAGKIGLTPLIEFSGGKGFHFWFLFQPSLPAGVVKAALESITLPISKDLSAFSLEVFPKQDRLTGKGLGNLVKLPLGVHRLTGRRSVFMECADRSDAAQLTYLLSFKPANPQTLFPAPSTEICEVVRHPSAVTYSETYPELSKLEQLCPPLAKIFSLCRNRQTLTLREEKILYQTLGFLPNAKTLIHYLDAFAPDYNPHLTDYKLSRVRGTPLGCKRIHSLLSFNNDMCRFDHASGYHHPLLHIGWKEDDSLPKSEKADNLQAALTNLKAAILQVERFMGTCAATA